MEQRSKRLAAMKQGQMNPLDIPLAVYLHFPWCVSKCPYCDFNSFANKEGALPETRYVDALLADLAQQIEFFGRDRAISSVFMGGGTPSLFSPTALARVLAGARQLVPFAADVEVTMEANPGSIERGRFTEYRAAGINRVSLGAQSFSGKHLQALGRIHGPEETRQAASELHAAGLSNFNLDLMYGLPNQTVTEAGDDLRAALALEPQHLSHYQLTIEVGTPLAAAPPLLPDDDLIDAMLTNCQQLLAAQGFTRYEVSAYARAGRQCRHNCNYWQFGDYLGVGAGAHGKLTTAAGVVRTTRLREPRKYLAAPATELAQHRVAGTELPFEFMLNALRLVDGFDQKLFESRTGLDFAALAPQLAAFANQGLLESPLRGRWRCSARGLLFLNQILEGFLPEPKSLSHTKT